MISRRTAWLLIGPGLVFAAPWACSSSGNSGTTATGGSGGSGPSTSTSTTTAVSTGAGGSQGAPNLGLACTSDADCGSPLTCILPTANDPVFGGGPANGYCSQSCTSDANCPSNGVCLTATSGGTGDCVATCSVGPALVSINDPLDPTKCQGRDDARCQPVDQAGTTFACIPTCGEDSQCATGQVCDPRLSVCVASASVSTGLPNGSACDPNATTPDCAAVCVSFTGGSSSAAITLCTEECVLGGDVTSTANCGGLSKGICAFSPQGNGAGDYGFCAPACNAQSDCQNPNFWCFPINGLTGKGPGMVSNGYCFGATACPNGNGDCSMDTGTTCTQTSGGPFCLNPMFPLPAGDGGTGDGGSANDGGSGTGGSATDAGSGSGTGGSATDAGSATGGSGTGGADGG